MLIKHDIFILSCLLALIKTALNSRPEAVNLSFKIDDAHITFFFYTFPVKAETGTDAIFPSAVPSPVYSQATQYCRNLLPEH